jgi:hypothetical protein
VAETTGLMAEVFSWTDTERAEAAADFEIILARRHRVQAAV